ncbi:hypothetical protein IWQ60_012112 [Tieghemiomyces parasiticus]|uniref:Subtilisin n=1 Tax=Tieghemiomyces parasiticus TaxID=78921 RepID=A0A9W7ZFW2_9FUNG|nr:hypothetical protein IWQ60_012112 [Tieghemiomyces parasiticus]
MQNLQPLALASSSLTTTGRPLPMLQPKYTGVDKVHAEGRLSGEGIKVGIIDSGLDYRHPAFCSCFKTVGCRVAYGYDFVGDNYNGTNSPESDDDPLDTCAGHGTHVAGILAGDDGAFQGVAPKATLGIYRVFSCKGTAPGSAIPQALDTAFDNSIDVAVTERLYRKGVVVVAGVGNSYVDGLGMVGTPAGGPGVLAVAAAVLPEQYAFVFNVTYPADDGTTTTLTLERSVFQTPFAMHNFTSTALVRGIDTSGSDLLCNSASSKLEGKVALVQRGTCDFSIKSAHAKIAGAVAIVFYDNVDEPLSPPAFIREALPSFMITLADGMKLVALLNTEAVDSVTVAGAFGPADYTSWGPTAQALLKPDVMAPGSTVYSTYPLNMNNYTILSGTSMATPATYGEVTLLLQSGKHVAAGQLYSALVHTATPFTEVNSGRPMPPILQGTDLLNCTGALAASLLPSVCSFSLKHLEDTVPAFKSPASITWNLTAKGFISGGYQIEYVPALAAAGFYPNGTAANPPVADTTFLPVANISPTTLHGDKVDAATSFSLSFNPQDLGHELLMAYSGYVRIYPTSGSRVNYIIGVVGYNFPSSRFPTLLPSGPSVPCLVDAASALCIDAGQSFTMQGNHTPAFALRLQTPVYRILLRVTRTTADASTASGLTNGATASPGGPTSTPGSAPLESQEEELILSENYASFIAKNGASNGPGYYSYIWDGTVMANPEANNGTQIKTAPDGDYAFKLTFYRMSMDDTPFNWTSPSFTIRTMDSVRS